jgi:hypothetical protein
MLLKIRPWQKLNVVIFLILSEGTSSIFQNSRCGIYLGKSELEQVLLRVLQFSLACIIPVAPYYSTFIVK